MTLPAPGDLLAGRYRLAEVIGIGGMAQVYRARDRALDRFVAVKVFRRDSDLADRRRFDAEVRILRSLDHPGLVPIHDSGIHDTHSFLVLGLVDGPTLRHAIADGPLPLERVRRLGANLADALACVHGNEIVHRDIKPSNILLTRDDRAVLADFGLARLLGSPRLTSSSRMTGTAAYLAPEQVAGVEVGCPADIYALGLVLLECLSGKPEYEGTDIETAVARLHRPPAVPRDLPDDLVRLFSLMTALAPRRRPDAAGCARVLRADQRVRSRRKVAPRVLVVAGSAVTALTAGVLAWSLSTPTTSSDAPPPPDTTATPGTPAARLPAPSSADSTLVVPRHKPATRDPVTSTAAAPVTTTPAQATTAPEVVVNLDKDTQDTTDTTVATDQAKKIPPGQVKKTHRGPGR